MTQRDTYSTSWGVFFLCHFVCLFFVSGESSFRATGGERERERERTKIRKESDEPMGNALYVTGGSMYAAAATEAAYCTPLQESTLPLVRGKDGTRVLSRSHVLNVASIESMHHFG